MLHDKDIKNLSELKLSFLPSLKKPEFFVKFIKILKLGKYHSFLSIAKEKGFSPLYLIQILISFPFITQKSVNSFVSSSWNKYLGIGKDAYYRIKNNPKVNWRAFFFAVFIQAIATIKERENHENVFVKRTTAFVFDDSPIMKTGHKIEGISKIWNHVIQKSMFGFQLLVMGYYDGVAFLPVNFSLHREKGKNDKRPYGLKPKHYKEQYKKKRDNKTHGAERKKELNISKILSVKKMIIYAVKKGITANYVLTDSWFTCWELVKTSIDNNLKFIGMFSKVKTLFRYNGKEITYKEIRHLERKKIKRNKRFNLYYICTVVEWKGEKIVLYFTRKGKKGNWKTILSTDLNLNFTQTIETYQIRWTIEVFFKESKQMLDLGKSQSNDFDAQIADTTINLIQYIFLALQNRVERYETLGKLFKNTKESIIDTSLQHRLIALLIAIIEILSSMFENEDEDELFEKIINDDRVFERIRRLIIIPDNNNLKNIA